MNRHNLFLAVRILFFAGLGSWFIITGLGFELQVPMAVFIGIGAADWLYAALLARPFLLKGAAK